MIVQLDGLMHEVIGKIIPFYEILDKDEGFTKLVTVYQNFSDHPLSKNNIALSCNKLRGNLYTLENSKTVSDNFLTASRILKDLHNLSHRWIMEDDPVKLILCALTESITNIFSNIDSYDKLKIAFSSSKPSLKKLIDLHKDFPCREKPEKIEYVI
jgi:hypothetical protein